MCETVENFVVAKLQAHDRLAPCLPAIAAYCLGSLWHGRHALPERLRDLRKANAPEFWAAHWQSTDYRRFLERYENEYLGNSPAFSENTCPRTA